MKKFLCVFLAASVLILFSPAVFAQDENAAPAEPKSEQDQINELRAELAKVKQTATGFKLGGEAKTGIYWQSVQNQGEPLEEYIGLHNMDDAGGYQQQGRFRLNMEYENPNGFGFKARIQWQNFGTDPYPDVWPYAFGYGNFFNDQLTVAVGKLGGSPWGTGGPELWKDLENVDKSVGMRVEYKPGFPVKYGKLNVGFVLNYFNADRDQGWHPDRPIPITMLLQESLLGVSYTLPGFFQARFAYKFDSEYDAISDNKNNDGKGEDEIVYRVEELILNKYVPGLKVWALGHLFGVSAPNDDMPLNDEITRYINYAFIEYEPPAIETLVKPFTAQLRIGYDVISNRSVLHLKPSFYWNFANKLLSVGASFWYGQDFGVKLTEGSPYSFIEVEPKVQLNFQSSYIAFVYVWRSEYFHEHLAVDNPETGGKYDPIKQTQKMNLRFCIYF